MSKLFALSACIAVSCSSAVAIAQAKPAAAPAKPIAIHAAHMLDGVSKQLQGPVTVTLLNGRITNVQSGIVCRAGADVIDLGDDTLLPGLIDAHKHMGGAPQSGLNVFQARLTISDLEEAIGSAANAR